MKLIDTTGYDVFRARVSHEQASDWLMDAGAELIDVNSAIDDATSHAGDHGKAYVIIEIRKHPIT